MFNFVCITTRNRQTAWRKVDTRQHLDSMDFSAVSCFDITPINSEAHARDSPLDQRWAVCLWLEASAVTRLVRMAFLTGWGRQTLPWIRCVCQSCEKLASEQQDKTFIFSLHAFLCAHTFSLHKHPPTCLFLPYALLRSHRFVFLSDGTHAFNVNNFSVLQVC